MGRAVNGTVYVGVDSREPGTAAVCMRSLEKHMPRPRKYKVASINLSALQDSGWYRRPTLCGSDGQLFDVISDAPMSTEFALSRFYTPLLADHKNQWALFCDGDFMFRADVGELFALADNRYAVMVVKHDHVAHENMKMRGYAQQNYDKKNWSSLILWNLHHPRNRRLTLEVLNAMPGLWFHQFKWLGDDTLIGALPSAWNWLYGVSDPATVPKAVHFTNGTPAMMPFVNEWVKHSNERIKRQ